MGLKKESQSRVWDRWTVVSWEESGTGDVGTETSNGKGREISGGNDIPRIPVPFPFLYRPDLYRANPWHIYIQVYRRDGSCMELIINDSALYIVVFRDNVSATG